jgi:aryl-alcohol dehydrogenase-like predicted oxidoreductase
MEIRRETSMIEQLDFGRTGHTSSRVIFGAAALAVMRQERADAVLATLLEFGVNHIDTAASYGDSELRLAPWLGKHRGDVFLASKTGDRDGDAARTSLERSLERLQVQQLDLIQLHNLTDEAGWQRAMAPGGALEACGAARDEGLVRFIGVTGHGTLAPAMHLRSLERFDFDSVLVPYTWAMMQNAEYARDFERLLDLCGERNVAVQTIKSIARRRWREDDPSPRYSWYEPLRDPAALRRAVHWVLARPGVFLNSSSDATLLRPVLEAAAESAGGAAAPISEPDLMQDVLAHEIEPLFVRGVSDGI